MTDSNAAPAPAAPPLTLGIVLYPGFTLLDLAGPQGSLGLHGQTLLLSKTLEPVTSDTGVMLVPTTTFADCPTNLDVLLVPGGMETNAAMRDKKVLDFLARIGPNARYVTSVCSGALLLGMAGLLEGYRAATHWAAHPALEAIGVEAVHERVVADRNRFTGGGVTAGIDFGLTLLAELRGEQVAKVTQLILEYDPKPPFDTGTPEKAGPEIAGIARAITGSNSAESIEIARNRRREPVVA